MRLEKDFTKIVGQTFKFYGATNCQFKLNSAIWEAVEDPDDGYRSMMEEVQLVENSEEIFFKRAIAIVKVVSNLDQTYSLIDEEDGHQWLLFGTDDYEDYYPIFVFQYSPKEVK